MAAQAPAHSTTVRLADRCSRVQAPEGRSRPSGGSSVSGARPGSPLTQQRSAWQLESIDGEVLSLLVDAGCRSVACWRRRVTDGVLTALVTRNPPSFEWHLSVSHAAHSARRAKRYPSWDELAHARYQLLPLDIDVVMRLPPPESFIDVHDTTFHLHEERHHTEREDGP